MKTVSHEKLLTGNIPKLIIGYGLTTLIALLLNSIYTLTDSLFVSWGVGDNAMGGVSLVYPFVLIQSAIATALGGGAASIISRKIGNGELSDAGEVAFNARVVFYITAIIVTAVGYIAMEPLLQAFGATDEIYHYAKQYFVIILAGNIFSTGFSAIIRAEGRITYSLLIWVVPVFANIVFDALFILVFRWGVAGSAAATVVCQFSSFVMSMLFFTKFSVLKMKGFRLKRKTVADIVSMGLPALAQSAVLSVSLLIMNNILKLGAGTVAINSFAYINKILAFALMPFLAVTQAISPLIGVNFGAGKNDRVRKITLYAILISVIYACVGLLLIEAAPKYLIMIFTDNAEIIAIATVALRIIIVSLPFSALPMILGAVYQAKGKKGIALLLYVVFLIFFLPLSILMVKLLGVTGAWWSYVLSYALATTVAALVFFIENQKARKQNKLFLLEKGEE